MVGEEPWSREASDDVPDSSHMSDEQFHQLLDQYWADQGFDIRGWIRASRQTSRSTAAPTRQMTTSWQAVTFDEDGVARFSGYSDRSGGLDDQATGGFRTVDLLNGNGNGSGGATPASSMAIVSLPEMTVGDEKGELKDCPVCLQGFEVGDKLRRMPCVDSHCFHEQCIFNWLLINRHCPLCRFPLPAETEEEEEVVQAENHDNDDGEETILCLHRLFADAPDESTS